ncbi:hypothetical protein AURDEDRAFT_171132 [Auricularia subglabra TFB-10046 SS5]|nr:hypothetical protein AURDEDRAFT_171132 [Auricularia subglabra TFB-10046 SS5]
MDTTRPGSIASTGSWQEDLAQSFSHLAETLRATQHGPENLLARIEALEAARAASMPDALAARLDAVEAAQARTLHTLEEIKASVDAAGAGSKTAEEFAKIVEEFKLEQLRLPPRLFNAAVFKSGAAIRPLPVGLNGKTPSNFPNTKGEFEHITRERYAELLKAYGLSTAGEKEERRERLRTFLGLTPA